MGIIERLFGMIFGSNRNLLRETVEVFQENAEGAGQRASEMQNNALDQYASEFSQPERGGFDRFMDGVNRLPRPMLALGTLGLFIAAMIDPVWFAVRMQGIALVPEPLWWLLGAIVSFYFGARHQIKGQEFQRQITQTMARVPQVVGAMNALNDLHPGSPGVATTGTDADANVQSLAPDENAALNDWTAAMKGRDR